jgi:hypothetical protein
VVSSKDAGIVKLVTPTYNVFYKAGPKPLVCCEAYQSNTTSFIAMQSVKVEKQFRFHLRNVVCYTGSHVIYDALYVF